MYFTMESLNQVHFLYQYSLKMFLDMFGSVLYSNPGLQQITDYGKRLSVITADLFSVIIFFQFNISLHLILKNFS